MTKIIKMIENVIRMVKNKEKEEIVNKFQLHIIFNETLFNIFHQQKGGEGEIEYINDTLIIFNSHLYSS